MGEFSQLLSHDDSAVNIVRNIIVVVVDALNVKNEVYKTVIGDVVAHMKPQKFTVSSDL